MSVNASVGTGTLFKRGDGASAEAFTAIAEINNIDGPGFVREIADVSDLSSTWREHKGTIRDGQTLTINCNFTHDTYADWLADLNNNNNVNYQLVWPDAEVSTLSISGFVTELSTATPLADKINVTVTIKVSGQPSFSS